MDSFNRRSMVEDEPAEDVLGKDACFAIATAIHLLASHSVFNQSDSDWYVSKKSCQKL